MKYIACPGERFERAVYDIVRLVPPGRVTSYGAVARAAGLRHGARMVGRIMSRSGEGPEDIPAHRVVNSRGVLSAVGTFPEMRRRLESEGVAVHGNRIRNWADVFWDPLEELSL